MKKVQLMITKDKSDNAETKFISFNGKAIAINVGVPVWVDEDYYIVLKKGNLADRTVKMAEK